MLSSYCHAQIHEIGPADLAEPFMCNSCHLEGRQGHSREWDLGQWLLASGLRSTLIVEASGLCPARPVESWGAAAGLGVGVE